MMDQGSFSVAFSVRVYRELEAGRLHISSELYERICDVSDWPR